MLRPYQGCLGTGGKGICLREIRGTLLKPREQGDFGGTGNIENQMFDVQEQGKNITYFLGRREQVPPSQVPTWRASILPDICSRSI